jgi:hypothetical protein
MYHLHNLHYLDHQANHQILVRYPKHDKTFPTPVEVVDEGVDIGFVLSSLSVFLVYIYIYIYIWREREWESLRQRFPSGILPLQVHHPGGNPLYI